MIEAGFKNLQNIKVMVNITLGARIIKGNFLKKIALRELLGIPIRNTRGVGGATGPFPCRRVIPHFSERWAGTVGREPFLLRVAAFGRLCESSVSA
jgi:hypothetical protein